MLETKTDYIFIIIFFIVVACFLGISIVNIVDKKLSNISINVPKIKLPSSEVIVNFEKNGNKYKVKCTKKKKSKRDKKSQPLKNKNVALLKEEEGVALLEEENELIKDDVETNNIAYSDLESEYGDNVQIGEEINYNDISEENLIEGMGNLTAEKFYEKYYVTPYVPDLKRINNNNGYEPYNNNEYQ